MSPDFVDGQRITDQRRRDRIVDFCTGTGGMCVGFE